MHAHDRGLAHDLEILMQRRRALRWLAAGAGSLSLLGCGGGDATSDSSTGTASGSSTGSSCATIPEETAGPYPGDGSNSSGGAVANALALSGIVRHDIRSSIAGASAVAQGVPLVVQINLVNSSAACADLAGYAIYLWHCDRDGRYSMYSAGLTGENYLRGVQETDSSGAASFLTVFPGCYDGRMPHMHFEVYRSLASATSYTNKLKTSQIAFPVDTCTEVYAAASGYDSSASNFSRISFATDNVFSDGVTLQMAGVTGSVANGYAATLSVGIAA
jgi:protocatechuate 3,4-dioxygenase beta subunit